MTTIHISEETHLELKKIKGTFLAANGKERSFDEIIQKLIKTWKERRKE